MSAFESISFETGRTPEDVAREREKPLSPETYRTHLGKNIENYFGQVYNFERKFKTLLEGAKDHTGLLEALGGLEEDINAFKTATDFNFGKIGKDAERLQERIEVLRGEIAQAREKNHN